MSDERKTLSGKGWSATLYADQYRIDRGLDGHDACVVFEQRVFQCPSGSGATRIGAIADLLHELRKERDNAADLLAAAREAIEILDRERFQLLLELKASSTAAEPSSDSSAPSPPEAPLR